MTHEELHELMNLRARLEELEREVGRRRAVRAKAAKAVRTVFSWRTAKAAIYLAVLGAAGAFLVAATITAPPSISSPFQTGTAISASAVNGDFSVLWANDQAINTELAGKATLASPTFTGILTINSPAAGAPATSGSSDSNIVSRVWCSSIALDTGVYGSGVMWMQNRMYNNYALNFGMALQPNGGNVGIGTATPGYLLTLRSSNDTQLGFVNTQVHPNDPFAMIATHHNSISWIDGYLGFYLGNNYATPKMVIAGNGNVGIGIASPGYVLTVNGQPGCNGYTQFTNYSDSRLKENIRPIDGALDSIMKLDPVTFNYNKNTGYDEATRRTEFAGFVAQDLEKVFPQMVGKNTLNGQEYLDSNLSALPVYTARAVQELKAEKDAEIQALHDENATLMARLAAVEDELGMK